MVRVAASTSRQAAPLRESDRAIRLLKLGNAGGGKGPDFWCAFEDGEVNVIGDEPRKHLDVNRPPRCRR
jgi:hypothetical protein